MDPKHWLKDTLTKIDIKLDALAVKVEEIDRLVIKNTYILEEHQRRSEANEKNIELLREEMKPIKNHVHIIHGFLKLFGAMSTLTSIIIGLLKLYTLFR